MPPPRGKRFARRVPKKRPKVFLVHGHNGGLRETVARFLERLGCEVIVLHELPSKGRTILQKFRDYSDVEFAIVLLIGDDRGGTIHLPVRKQRRRARQN